MDIMIVLCKVEMRDFCFEAIVDSREFLALGNLPFASINYGIEILYDHWSLVNINIQHDCTFHDDQHG